MTTTSAVTGNYDWTSLNPTQTSSASSASTTQDRFLKLLVTQMKNQDPLNPMDNAEVTSQMAQLNTVTGIDKLNSTMSSLAASFGLSQSIQAANLVGHGVLISGSNLNLKQGGALFGVNLPQSVDSLTVSIQDSAGKVLHTVDVGPHAAGTVVLGWDGATDAGTTAGDGSYNFVVKASSAGAAVTASPLSFGLVTGVSNGASGVTLNLGNSQTAQLADVKQVM